MTATSDGPFVALARSEYLELPVSEGALLLERVVRWSGELIPAGVALPIRAVDLRGGAILEKDGIEMKQLL